MAGASAAAAGAVAAGADTGASALKRLDDYQNEHGEHHSPYYN